MKVKVVSFLAAIVFAFAMNAQAQWIVSESWNLTGNSLSTNSSFLGTTNSYPLIFKTNDSTRLHITPSGNIGINTTNPMQMLHIVGGNILISKPQNRAPGSTNGSIMFGEVVTQNNSGGNWAIEYNTDTTIHGLNFWRPWIQGHGMCNFVLFLADNDNVGIGTCNPQAKLSVNGGILAKSVRVNTSSTYWPDYVFKPNYDLMGLKELEAFISANMHLPGVPSATEIGENNQMDLGKMNTLLLQKVEELTLYIIDLQKQIDELKAVKEE